MKINNFDEKVERSFDIRRKWDYNLIKSNICEDTPVDFIPLWIADMDFKLPDKLIALLKKRTPVYGTIQKSFSKNDALEILEECLKSRIAILGGDVVNINNNGYFEYNYDNWSYNRKK